jgi:hypothetical protein
MFSRVLENINWLFFDVRVLTILFWWSENSAMFFGSAGKLHQVNTIVRTIVSCGRNFFFVIFAFLFTKTILI